MPRPFVRSSLADLETAFHRQHADPQFLSVLIDEIAHRSTLRAARLRARAEEALRAASAVVPPKTWSLPSPQRLESASDAATPYIAEFVTQHGSRAVGVPLLVHRRCAAPMFGISNAIAYERVMVDARRPGPSAPLDAVHTPTHDSVLCSLLPIATAA